MPFNLITGTYHVNGFEPDGDSIRFQADDPAAWARLRSRFRPKLNARGQVQLRLEGIDALETHFAAGGLGRVHQPLALADAARDRLLALLGITDVVLGRNGSTIASARDGTPGFVLARDVDVNRRPISFAFAGAPPVVADPARVYLDAGLLARSANQALIEDGLAYPIFYTSLFADLRTALATATQAARTAGKGVWPGDRTGGLDLASLAALTDEAPVMPKLFRRLTAYIAANAGSLELAGFKPWLAAENERVIVLADVGETGFDDVVVVEGDRVGLDVLSEELIFVPK